MTEPNKKDFCPRTCKFLSPWEINQSAQKESHECARFRRVLGHMGYHPDILRCGECLRVEAEKKGATKNAITKHLKAFGKISKLEIRCTKAWAGCQGDADLRDLAEMGNIARRQIQKSADKARRGNELRIRKNSINS